MSTTRFIITRRRLLMLAGTAAITSPASAAGVTKRQQKTLHERLATEQGLLGLLQTYPNRSLEELAGECGYDFLMLDGEHGVFSDEDFRGTLKRLANTDVLSFLRVPKSEPRLVDRYLGLGADVIVAPLVSTVEEAKALARAAASRNGSLIVILETKRGVQNAQAILAVDGVHGAMVGPGDLSTDLGIPGQFADPTYAQAVSQIELAAAKANKPLGTIPHGNYSLKVLGARGHRLFILTSDQLLMRTALRSEAAAARSTLSFKP